ncbi:MAG: 50S ribosomal protein L31e [Haloferacaceae archaeon]
MSTSDFEERVVTVPLRDAKAAPVQERADAAMRIVREHLAQHFSVEEGAVRLDPSLNEAVWARGRRKPPNSLRVRAARFVEEGEPIVEAEPAE